MRIALTHTAIAQLRDGRNPTAVAGAVTALLKEKGLGEGGLILVDPFGRMGFAYNTPTMGIAYAWMDQGDLVVMM